MKGTLLRSTLPMFGILTAAAIVNPAAADVTATRVSGNGSATEIEDNGRWTVEIDIPSTGTTEDHIWLIEADDNDAIDAILVDACEISDPLRPVYLIIQPIGSGAITEIGDIRFESASCFTQGAALVIASMDIAGDITGDILVQGIDDAIVGGDLTGTITIPLQTAGQTPSVQGIVFLEILGDMISTITSFSGPFDHIRILGTVYKVDSTPSISGPELGRLVAGSFAGEIDISGQVGRIEISAASGHPDLSGEVSVGSFASIDPTSDPAGLYVDDALDADITVGSALTHPIVIGGDLTSSSTITLPSGGLQSLIRINNRDISADWDGTIAVGTTDLTSSTYAATATSLGGGSAGLAPYDLHATSCDPVEGSTIFITGIDIFDPELNCVDIPFTEAVLRSYGPVEFVGSPPYFAVQTHDGTVWQPASFSLDAAIVSGSDDLEISFTRPSSAPWPMGFHSIKPLEGKVVCKGVGATSAPDVAPWSYIVELADGCGLSLLSGFDLNNDTTLCAQDIAAWMSDPVDLNGDEAVCSQDMTRLVEAIDRYNSLD